MLARRALIALLCAGGVAACAGESGPAMPGTSAGAAAPPLQQATDNIAGRGSAATRQGAAATMGNAQTQGESVVYTGQGSGQAGSGVRRQAPGASPTFGGRGS